jgi:hypothetical protein
LLGAILATAGLFSFLPGTAPAVGGDEQKPAAASSPLPADIRSGRKAILEALEETTAIEFSKTPLRDVIHYLQCKHKVLMVLDRKALRDVGIDSDTLVTVNLRGITLRSALNLMLREMDLTWSIRDDVLGITTSQQGETWLITEVYDVGDLVTCRNSKGELWDDYDTLIGTIEEAIQRNTWGYVGGPGSIGGTTYSSAKVLIVSQTNEAHRETAELLEKIRRVVPKDAQPPLRDKPLYPRPTGEGFW